MSKQDKKEKSIYDLKLHEGVMINNTVFVMRVASGWIYDCWDIDKDIPQQGIFVPFDNSFKYPNRNKAHSS